MKIALIQQPATADKSANLERGLENAMKAIEAGAKIIGFAELAFEPFYPQFPAGEGFADLTEPIPGPITDAFCELAKKHEVVFVLTLFEVAEGKTYDSSPVIDADGTILGTTRMVHITEYPCFDEQGYYAEGDNGTPVYDTRFGKVAVAICYDRHYQNTCEPLASPARKSYSLHRPAWWVSGRRDCTKLNFASPHFKTDTLRLWSIESARNRN